MAHTIAVKNESKKVNEKTIEMEMPARNRDDVKRSRNECEHDKHFSKDDGD